MRKKLLKHLLPLVAVSLMLNMMSCSSNKQIVLKPYPQTAKDSTVDDYFGTKVADPYRWLEDDNSQATAEWVVAQNDVTFDYLSQIPFRDGLRERLTELWNYRKTGAPEKVGEYYLFYDNDGLQNQSVLYRRKGADGAAEVFIDPNTLSEDGTVALSGVSFSKDDKYAAYSVAESGSDWVEIRLRDIETGEDLDDVIKWVKFSTAVWTKDGFYYSRYDEPKSNAYSARNEFHKVYFHKIGDPQSKDELIYWDPKQPLRYFNAQVSSDDKYLFINASEGTSGSEILYRRNNSKAPFKVLLKGFDHDYVISYAKGDDVFIHTNQDAPCYRLAKMNLSSAKPQLETIIAEQSPLMLNAATVAGGYIFADYLEKAQSKIIRYDLDGKNPTTVELPGIGTVAGFEGKSDDTTLYYSYTSYINPACIYAYDVASGKSELYAAPELSFDPSLYTCEQVFYPSKDGTPVSMFIVHRKDIVLDGTNPTFLYGYGGFSIPLTPSFAPKFIAMLEQGGVYAVANLRGGNEYGEAWHQAGMLENKQNVFDDFISAGEYLIKEGYTSTSKLAISGGSNGGLLVGACLVQRPDLFAVALPAVGVLDMLRYHKFTIGWGWAVEYGSSDYQDQFEYIYKYSPLHNIKEGTSYPATMVTTGDHDDRVVPAHSFKFAASLQAAQAGDKPTIIRIDTNAGHGAGKPTAKRIEEQADELSFFFYNTNSEVNL